MPRFHGCPESQQQRQRAERDYTAIEGDAHLIPLVDPTLFASLGLQRAGRLRQGRDNVEIVERLLDLLEIDIAGVGRARGRSRGRDRRGGRSGVRHRGFVRGRSHLLFRHPHQ